MFIFRRLNQRSGWRTCDVYYGTWAWRLDIGGARSLDVNLVGTTKSPERKGSSEAFDNYS